MHATPTRSRFMLLIFLGFTVGSPLSAALAQGLPPVPFPPQNAPSEAKRVLGKILFWDEQLSSDDNVACGTCHRPAAGGADPRLAIHPGPDGIEGTADDIHGSFGVERRDGNGQPIHDPVFGLEPQVTGRLSPSFFGTLHSPEQFWDGRAGSTFTDPLDSGSVLIPAGGGLESQAVGPLLNHVEMARDGRTWADVTTKLAASFPLRLADDRPADTASAIDAAPSYPALFEEAFGDDEITPARIAFAIATYERSLVPDQTPWDDFIAGDTSAMTANQVRGWNTFRGNGARCNNCHTAPFFTNHDFLNIGLRPADEDEGRRAVTGLAADFGDMKVAGLRNVGLRARLMHTGGIVDVTDAVDFYLEARGHEFFRANQDGIPPAGTPLDQIRIRQEDRGALIDFLSNALTDPRAEAELFPFDRPSLASEAGPGVVRCAETPRNDCLQPIEPQRSPLKIKSVASGDKIIWKPRYLEETLLEDFGDPASTDGVALCLYDGPDGNLIFEGRAAADADCDDRACWRTLGSEPSIRGWRYRGSSDGARKITLKAGEHGRAKLAVVFSGALSSMPLGMPGLPLALPVVVQMESSSGTCWRSEYLDAKTNEGSLLVAR